MIQISLSKICKKCNQEKALNDFYVHQEMSDGHLGFCKVCVKKRVTQHRVRNVERIRKYDRFRRHVENQSEEQKADRAERGRSWRSANRTKNNKIRGLWRDGKRTKAHNTTSRKLKKDKPDKCSICNVNADLIHGHHEDYDKPSEVIWCCTKCHGKLHRIDERKRYGFQYNAKTIKYTI